MVSEGTTARINGHRIAALCGGPDVEQIELIDGHRTRKRMTPGVWPRTPLNVVLTTSRTVTVETPAKLMMKVVVRFYVEGEYLYASARPADQVWGESLELPGDFPRQCEVLAERLALELI